MTYDWRARALRFSAFPTGPLSPADFDRLWQACGAPTIELEEHKPNVSFRRRFGVIENSMGIDCQCLPDRVDLHVMPLAGPDGPTMELVPAFDAMDMFKVRCDAALHSIGVPVRRLALAGTVSIGCKSREEVYEVLGQLVPSVRLDPQKSREFRYQINRPDQSSVLPDLLLNKLMTWVALRIEMRTMTTNILVTEPRFLATLEFDFNTDGARSEPLPEVNLPALAVELDSSLRRIMEAGELA